MNWPSMYQNGCKAIGSHIGAAPVAPPRPAPMPRKFTNSLIHKPVWPVYRGRLTVRRAANCTTGQGPRPHIGLAAPPSLSASGVRQAKASVLSRFMRVRRPTIRVERALPQRLRRDELTLFCGLCGNLSLTRTNEGVSTRPPFSVESDPQQHVHDLRDSREAGARETI